jgi:hypothetical protein
VTGKWVEPGADAVEALSALGLATEPGELTFLLIRRLGLTDETTRQIFY